MFYVHLDSTFFHMICLLNSLSYQNPPFYKDLLEREVKKIVLVLVFYPNCVYILYSFLQKAQGTYIYGLNYSCFMSAHLKGQKSLFTLLLSYGVVVSLPADDFTLI